MAEAAVASPPAEPKAPTLDAPSASEKAPSDFMSDVMGDFETMAAGKEPARESKPKPEAPRRQAKRKVDKQEEESAEPKVEKPKQTEEPEEKPESKPEKEKAPEGKSYMRTLGEKYDNLKKQVEHEFKPELQKLRAKVQEYETKQPEDASPLLEKIKALEGRNSELEKHIQYVDYTKSKDFETKYEQPYVQAWNDAVSEFRELSVREAAGEDEAGDPIYKTRPASEQDLIQLGSMRLSEMDEAAVKMFGHSAPRAVSHIQNLRKLIRAKNQALEEAKNKAQEWKASQSTENQSRSKEMNRVWEETNRNLKEKFPKAFDVEADDADDKASHTKGFALSDLLFIGPQALSPEQIEALPPSFRDTVKAGKHLDETQQIRLHALARLKMANHDRQMVKVKKLQEQVDELKAALAEYEESEPKGGKTGSSESKASSKDWLETVEDELRAMDK